VIFRIEIWYKLSNIKEGKKMDEESQELDITPETRPKRGKKKKNEGDEKPGFVFPDPQAAHKKFMLGMLGIFLLILALMIFLNQYFDFSVDGGI